MLQKKIDMMTPLLETFNKLGDAIKSALPGEAKIKLELDQTPLQEVDAAIQRTMKAAPETASSKLAGDPYKKSDASQDELYDQAMKRIDSIGARLSYLLQKIESGKDITGNAAQEADRLQATLAKVAQAARDSAKALGDEEKALKASQAESEASAGRMGGGGGAAGGGGYSFGQIVGMATNPMGYAKQTATSIIGDLMAEGGLLAGTAGAAVAGAALLVGSAYVGYKVNERLASQASSDAAKETSDFLLSRNAGQSFDFREGLFTADRQGPMWKTDGGYQLSNNEIRSFIRGMGVGVDNWQSHPGWSRNDSMAETGMLTANYAYRMGTSTEQLSNMIGASIRSGAITAGDEGVKNYLAIIAGATSEAAKQGVTTNEKLQSIATLNQRSAAASGFLTASAQSLNLQASGALQATGDKALQGQLGTNAIRGLAGNGNDEARAREIGFMLDSNGKLRPEYQALVDANPYLKELQRDMGDAMVASALLDDDSVRASVNQRGIRSMMGSGMSAIQASGLMGVSGTLSQRALYTYGAALKSGDILSYKNPELVNPRDDAGTKMGDNRILAMEAMMAGQQRDEVRQTGYSYEASKAMLEAATHLETASNNFGKWFGESMTTDWGEHAYGQTWGVTPRGTN